MHPLTKVRIHHQHSRQRSIRKGYDTTSSRSSISNHSSASDANSSENRYTFQELYSRGATESILQREKSLEKIHTFALKNLTSPSSQASLNQPSGMKSPPLSNLIIERP